MSDREEIKLEQEYSFFFRLLTNKRLILTIVALIMVLLISGYYSLSEIMFSPFIVLPFIILFALFFGLVIFIGSADRIVIFDCEGIEIRFGVFIQRSNWKALEGIEFNIDPATKKEVIVFREQERSWPITNFDYKEESWNKLRALIFKYGEKNKITIKS